MAGKDGDKGLVEYIKGYEKIKKDLEYNRKILIVANQTKPIPNIKDQLKSINEQIGDAENSIKEAKKIEKQGY